MIFQLECSNETKIYFDNIRNRFSLDIPTNSNNTPNNIIYNPFNINQVRVITIVLGHKCNQNCSYCIQQQLSKNIDIPIKVQHPLVESFCKKIFNIFDKDQIKHINLLGGEPLVYWSLLKSIIEQLRNCGYRNSIGFSTNGFLLDVDKIAFCAEHDVGINVSFDGASSKQRDGSCFEKKSVIDAVNYVINKYESVNKKIISVSPTISEHSETLYQIKKYVLDKLGTQYPFRNFRMNMGTVFTSIYDLTDEQYNNLIISPDKNQHIYKDLYWRLLVNKAGKKYRGFLESILRSAINNISFDKSRPICNEFRSNSIVVMVDGSILKCEHNMERMGDLDNILSYKTQPIKVPTKCFECAYLNICNAGCPLINDDNSKSFKLNCNNQQGIMKAFFNVLVYKLFNTEVNKIIPL